MKRLGYSKLPGIYRITSPSGRVYIGQTWNLYNRLKGYSSGNCKTQKVLYRSFMKYGIDAHLIEEIHIFPEDITQEILDNYEIFYIQTYKEARVSLINIKGGGSRGKHAEKSKDKLRGNNYGIKNKGKIRTAETKQKLSDAGKARSDNKGETHPMARLTSETVLQIREDHKQLGLGCRRLAKKYGISKTHATEIISRKTWKHI